MARVLFLHGSSVNPLNTHRGGRLQGAGHEVELCPDLPYPDDFAAVKQAVLARANRSWFKRAVRIAQDAFDRCKPDVVVGSSMGGAVAMNLRSGNTPQVLVAPAWRVFGVIPFGRAQTVKPATVIVQGDGDWLVRPGSSRRLLKASAPRQPWETALAGEIEQRLLQMFNKGEGLRVEGRLVRVAASDHRCNSEAGIQALLGAVEVLAGLPAASPNG
jgi:hypothetical protein